MKFGLRVVATRRKRGGCGFDSDTAKLFPGCQMIDRAIPFCCCPLQLLYLQFLNHTCLE